MLRFSGLDEQPLSKSAVIEWMQKMKVLPIWDEQKGLLFKPRIGAGTTKVFEQLLEVHSWEDVENLKKEMGRRLP